MDMYHVNESSSVDDMLLQILTTKANLSKADAMLVLDLSRKILDDVYGVVQRVTESAPDELQWHIAVMSLIRLNISSKAAVKDAGVHILGY